MSKFTQLTKQSFENYHNTPYESAEWTLTTALGHIMEFLAHHDNIDEMAGLRDALHAMTDSDWENWYARYPEERATLIEPLHTEIAQQSTSAPSPSPRPRT
jgi:hypothetical protein